MRTLGLSCLSSTLFLLPVIITVVVYAGIESQKVLDVLHGKIPLSATVPTVARPKGPRVIATDMYCNKSYAVMPFPGRYMYNPNQWGDPDNTGALCLSLTTDTGVPQNQLDAFNFSATWGYPQGPDTAPVHAFPNAQLITAALPLKISEVQNLFVDVDWTYAIGDDPAAVADEDSLVAGNLNCNVAVDMFFDSNSGKANNETIASHEVMVWLGQYGLATQPLGLSSTPADTASVNGTTFNLYHGANQQGQQVFTWIADGNQTTFVGDVSPLVKRLANIENGPPSNTYMGYMAFGSETLYASAGNVTFSVSQLTLEINGR